MASAHKLSPKSSRRREFECAVCLDRLCQPKTLSCFHNFCFNCLKGLTKDQTISCPTCRRETTLGPGGVLDLPKNISLINIMDTLCERCFYDDKEVLCDDCALWLCSRCHDRCKKKHNLEDKCKAFMTNLAERELHITEKKMKLTNNSASVMGQIDRSERDMIKHIRLRAKRLRDEVQQELDKQLDVLDKLTSTLAELKKEISDYLENLLLRENTGDFETESIPSDWNEIWKTSTKNLAEIKSSVEFTTTTSVPSIGRLVINKDSSNEQSLESLPGVACTAHQATSETAGQPEIDYQFERFILGSGGHQPGELNFPTRIAISPVTKNLLVLDNNANRIHMFDEHQGFIRQIRCERMSKNMAYKKGRADRFAVKFGGLAVTEDGLIVVADATNHQLQVLNEHGKCIRSITFNMFKRTAFGQVLGPQGVTVHDGLIYVCDSDNYGIQVLDCGLNFVRRFGSKDDFGGALAYDVTIHRSGDIYVAAGKLFAFSAEGKCKGPVNTDPVTLFDARGVTTDHHGQIIVSDFRSGQIHILTASGKPVMTLPSAGELPSQIDGPVGVLCTQDGHLGHIIVADRKNHRILSYAAKRS